MVLEKHTVQDVPLTFFMHTNNPLSLTSEDLDKLRRIISKARTKNNKYSWIRLVDTQSMSPSVEGDIDLLVQWTQSYLFQKGDLIVISKSNLPYLLVHRACEHRLGNHGEQVFQIADQFEFGNELSASWVDIETIIGRVVQIRYGQEGYIATLNSSVILNLSTKIAKLSLNKYNLQTIQYLKPKLINKLILQFTIMQHHSLCYIFRVMLLLNARSTQKHKTKNPNI